MSIPTAATAPSTVAAPPDAVRVVLFGMPDAGKSSLLGALFQATHTQNRTLKGRLIDLTNGLGEQWRRVYEDQQRETLDEIVAYPIVYEPFTGTADVSRLNVVLYDCDGRAANELLTQRKSLLNDARPGTLTKAIIDADALILPIDASASNEQLETDFSEFTRFLSMLESNRSREHAVGGLPVYLVLTKCDLLAREPITLAEWESRIEQRKSQVKDRFSRHLEGAAGASGTLLTFGSLDLNVFATAVKKPTLLEAKEQPREPLGVAELFRDCLRSAGLFRQRTISANRRLKFILFSASGFLVFAAVVAFLLFQVGGPVERPSRLAERVEQFRANEKPLPDRLANEVLQKRANALYELRDDAEFDRLSDDQRDYIRERIDELQTYMRLREQLAEIIWPEKARNLAELEQIRARFDSEAVVPVAFQSEWANTSAVLERQRRLNECQMLREAVDELVAFFTLLKNRANDRLFDTSFHARWEEETNAVLKREKDPPVNRTDALKGAAYDFDEVVLVENEWLDVRQRLQWVRDLAMALGLIGDPSTAVLAFYGSDEMDLGRSASIRLEKLKELYPNFMAWKITAIPDVLKAELRKKLQRSLEQMIYDGKQAVRSHLATNGKAGEDTAADWHAVAKWLLSDPMKDWHDLLAFMTKLLDPSLPDPVVALASFLQKDQFDVQIRELRLSIPNNLPQGSLTPADMLTLHFRPRGEKTIGTTLSYRLDKAATEDNAREKKYRFVIDSGDGKLTFKPGDELTAQLRLTKGSRTWQFSWANHKTAAYSLEALVREPFLHEAGSVERMTIADGVSLTVVDGLFPSIPVLLPDLRRNGK